MREIRAIQGAQCSKGCSTAACGASVEVIKATKVYDWIILASSGSQDVTVTGDCAAAITAAGVQNVNVTCAVGAVTCSASIIQRPITVQGSDQAACVRLCQVVPVVLTFSNALTGTVLCTQTGTVVISETTVVCLPEPLDASHIQCEVFDVVCNTTCPLIAIPVGDAFEYRVSVDINLCKDIQVEFDVKLQVEAQFAQPRAPIACQPAELCIPQTTFPATCPTIFPGIVAAACNCTGFLINSTNRLVTYTCGGVTETAAGQLCVEANICPNCRGLDSSTFTVSMTPDFGYEGDCFRFVASTFATATCDNVGGVITLEVTGTGTFVCGATGANGISTEDFTLTLTKDLSGVVGECSYDLVIGGVLTVTQIVDCDGRIRIENCTV